MAVCKSCGTPIEWARTEKGKRIPLDLRVRAENANLFLDDEGVVHYVAPGEGERISHFATCPNAKTHRR
jgi:hypothetical protein